ncbi:sugar phosphate isomerase/epimerase family protein [Pectinatus haikarae]|uniref:Sugar phosphate isomerase/epimerase n=1 Tax=Pectinatus haikarae TaxID=349096 RepID=A0ABT9Y827_9FIRM|nr:sugar phosphate isomerase/epimerase [Pectinatus haikarae]MDQ0203352.1 sugar phosphate isomerase/epimerase [Pectinatus haikarae]
MAIYISTNLYEPQQLQNIFALLKKMSLPIGIELFPEWQSEIFCKMLNMYYDEFKKHPITLHGPYYGTEHSRAEGTEEYARAMVYFKKTFELSRELKARHIVYHHNNCRIDIGQKQELITVSEKNLAKLRREAVKFKAKIVVENAGVLAHKNMLFDQDEFIEMAERVPEKILLDIGHAHANGWNIKYIIERLSDKIIAYHVHNNDGYEDKHDRIFHGTLDFADFINCYKKYTPNADIVVEYGKQCAVDSEGIAEDIDYIKKNITAAASK